jgi:hypothetical protein
MGVAIKETAKHDIYLLGKTFIKMEVEFKKNHIN